MAEYRRVYYKGGVYFFTVVTYHRRPIFKDPAAIEQLQDTIRSV